MQYSNICITGGKVLGNGSALTLSDGAVIIKLSKKFCRFLLDFFVKNDIYDIILVLYQEMLPVSLEYGGACQDSCRKSSDFSFGLLSQTSGSSSQDRVLFFQRKGLLALASE